MRALHKAPLFAAVVVTLLALGIGADTATFGVLNAVLLRREPRPSRLPIGSLSPKN